MMNFNNAWDPYSEFTKTKLNNGLNVYSAQWPGRPWEGVNFLIHTGAKHDPSWQMGIAHFVEHLVSANSGLLAKELIDFFEQYGGSINFGETRWENVNYDFFIPINNSQVISESFDIFGKILLGNSLVDDIEAERQVIINEYHLRFPTQFRLNLGLREHKAIFPGLWLENAISPLGSLDVIEKLSHSELQEYYNLHYNPANISIVAVGGMQHEDLLAEIFASRFGQVHGGIRTALTPREKDAPKPRENRAIIRTSEFSSVEINRANYYSVAVIPGDIDVYKLVIVKDMLCYILREELRQKRSWIYSLNVSFHDYGSCYRLKISSDSLSLDALDQIEDIVNSCIDSLDKHPKLFEKLKSSAISSVYMFDTTAKKICKSVIEDISLDGKIFTLGDKYQSLLNIQESDIVEILEYLCPERRWTMLVTP